MNYIIATSRSWNEILACQLQERTGHVFNLISSKEELTLERLDAINPRYIFFPHWSDIIPQEVYENYECVIFHMTDLPYGRGGSPLQNLILRGHHETQITAFRCVAELDAGPIYLKRPLSLEGSAAEIFLRAAEIIGGMVETIVREDPEAIPQQGEVTLFRRRRPDESNLASAHICNLLDLFNFIRMLDADGYPKAYLELHGLVVELSQAEFDGVKLIGTFVIRDKKVRPDN